MAGEKCVRWSAYCRVFPVAYDLLQVGGWVEEEVLPPLVPLNRHSAICIDAERERSEMESCSWTSGHAYILECPPETLKNNALI